MQNPYSVSGDSDATRCSAAWRLREWIVLALLIGLATHGGMEILKDFGVVVWYEGGWHFWFEEQLRQWIHE